MSNFPKSLVGGRVYHKPKVRRVPYAHGCNRETMRDASKSKKDYEGFDVDLRINREGTGWCHHQPFPTKGDAWFDPRNLITDRDHCTELSNAEMRRLRVRYQGANRPMLNAKQAAIFLRDLRPRRLVPCFEAKGLDKRFFDPEWWEEFRLWVPASTQRVIMSLPGGHNGRDGLRKLAAAREVGLPTMWLWRGDQPVTRTKAFKIHVDAVKSRPHRGIYLV